MTEEEKELQIADERERIVFLLRQRGSNYTDHLFALYEGIAEYAEQYTVPSADTVATAGTWRCRECGEEFDHAQTWHETGRRDPCGPIERVFPSAPTEPGEGRA